MALALELPRRWRTPEMRYHAEQARLITSPARFKVIAAGRRSGKTEVAKRDLVSRWVRAGVDAAMPHDWFGCAMAPTRDQARGIYWEDLKALVPSEFVRAVRETDLTIHHVNGPTLAVIGMDKPARAEGRPIDHAKVDEFADMKAGVWARHIRPALDTDGRPGSAWIYGVSRPSAQFQELAEYAKSGLDREWEFYHWPSSDILSAEAIEAARRELDERTFEQEYGGQWVAAGGRAYYAFDRALHVARELEYQPQAPLILCLDFNVEPGVAIVCQEAIDLKLGACTYVLGEIFIQRDSNTPRVMDRFLAEWGHHQGPVHYYGDPTGGNRGTAKLSGSDWDLVFQSLRTKFAGRLFDYVDRKKPHGDKLRTNAVNSRLKNALGEVRIQIAAKCAALIRDLENVILLEGTTGDIDKDADPSLTHASDALGYYMLARWPMGEHRFGVERI